ncbi:hypothetical protein PROFUN_16319, partial [Planoprotostelium fungivorum]
SQTCKCWSESLSKRGEIEPFLTQQRTSSRTIERPCETSTQTAGVPKALGGMFGDSEMYSVGMMIEHSAVGESLIPLLPPSCDDSLLFFETKGKCRCVTHIEASKLQHHLLISPLIPLLILILFLHPQTFVSGIYRDIVTTPSIYRGSLPKRFDAISPGTRACSKWCAGSHLSDEELPCTDPARGNILAGQPRPASAPYGKAMHILSHSEAKDASFFGISNINDCHNGIFACSSLEKPIEDRAICFIYDPFRQQYHCIVLDPTLKDPACPVQVAPSFYTFEHLNGKAGMPEQHFGMQ